MQVQSRARTAFHFKKDVEEIDHITGPFLESSENLLDPKSHFKKHEVLAVQRCLFNRLQIQTKHTSMQKLQPGFSR